MTKVVVNSKVASQIMNPKINNLGSLGVAMVAAVRKS